MFARLTHISERRAALRAEIDVAGSFRKWEESCVPSYCHRNWLAAHVSWLRLFKARDLADRFCPAPARILDFGSSVGELGQLVAPDAHYEFIEQDQHAADHLLRRMPGAVRRTLESAPDGAYDQVFAIDSLEHNDNFEELLAALAAKLSPRGVLILSGPTENRLYRLGRAIAGFSGHYHKTTIYRIEDAAAKLLTRRAVRSIMRMAPLFRISAWSRSGHA